MRNQFGRSGIALLILILVLGGITGRYAATGPRPWGAEVQKRTAAGQEFRAKEWGIIGVWWGCAASAGVCATLLFTAPLWVPNRRTHPVRPAPPRPQPGPMFHLGMLVVLGTSVFFRVPGMNHSLWNDEEYAMRRYAHGEFEMQKSGRLEFEPVKWEETLFLNEHVNNHLLNSAITRLALTTWRFASGAGPHEFNEIALRTPAVIASILTIVFVAMIGLELGGTWVGLGASALLALHPWHIRYSFEAKGYSFMLFFICLSLMALLHALRRDKVLSWLVFAIAQAGFLLSFAGSLYVAIALNAIMLVELLLRREARRIPTLIAFNLLSAIPVLIWMLPSIPQIAAYLKSAEILHTPIGASWLRDFGSHLMSGLLYNNPEPTQHIGTSWIAEAARSPLWWPVMGIVLPGLAAGGIAWAMFRRSAGRLAIVAIFAAGAISIVQNMLSGESLLVWYLLYLMIPICLAIPLALSRIFARAEAVGSLAILATITLFGIATQPARAIFVWHDRQPIRAVAEAAHERHPEAITAVFGVSDRQTLSYDPRVRILKTQADLDAVIAEARRDRRAAFVYYCGTTESGNRQPEVMKTVQNPALFEFVADYPGTEAMFSYHLFRLKPELHVEAPSVQ
ncbi:MAG: glycosyltransferase family 39 protein [Verrucomicrobiales bacterium]|nr:glycosyltransferase family 39 protein [Verrucomicrobiales bacterium]